MEHRTPPNLKDRVRDAVVNLIKNEDVDTFFVGEIGGYERDCYDVVLDVQKDYPQIYIYLIVSKMSEINEVYTNAISRVIVRRYFDDFIFPPKCEYGYKKLCIVYRNQYIVENTDFIIAYNKHKGRAYEFCKKAKNKGVHVLELSESL